MTYRRAQDLLKLEALLKENRDYSGLFDMQDVLTEAYKVLQIRRA